MKNETLPTSDDSENEINVLINLPQDLLEAIDLRATEYGVGRETLIEKFFTDLAKDFFESNTKVNRSN